MEPDEEAHTISPSELLHLAENHLRLRNYSLSSQYALESLHSSAEAEPDSGQGLPNRAQQIVAASDVLFAASRTLGSPVPNWYSVLGLDTFCSDHDLIRSKFRSLLLLLGPVKSSFPPAEEALVSVWNAWNVLGNPDKKSDFDTQLQADLPPPEDKDSFWTVCPYCYFMYEYARVFEGYCLRCQNAKCRRVFQGISTRSPPPVRSNQDVSFGCMGYFPLGYSQLEDATGGKQFPPWSPFVGMFELPDKRTTPKSKGMNVYKAAMEVSESPVLNAVQGNGPNVMNSYKVTASGKMRMQRASPLQLNRSANLSDATENRGIAMEANCDQYEGEYGFASQEYDPLQFVEKDGEIFLEVSSGGED